MIFFKTRINFIRRRVVAAGLLFLFILPPVLPAGRGADITEGSNPPPRFAVERWTAAEAVFHSDPRWLGGDGAASVDLGNRRILWLFGDSFVDPSGNGNRRSSTLVRNAVGVQTGYDPVSASMVFAWKTMAGKPTAFFPESGDAWYWPASGIMLGKRLLVFLMTVRSADNNLGFEPCGWKAVWIDNPQVQPDSWNMIRLVSPQQQGLVVGVGTPVLKNGFLYAFAAGGKDHSVYLVRWPATAASAGTLTMPQWWAGEAAGWITGPSGTARFRPVFTDGQMEFSVTVGGEPELYRRIQTKSLLNPCLSVSTAPFLTGPWTAATCFFTPPETGPSDLLIYAGKAHPALRGADLVLSYVVNTTDPERLLTDMSIYFPVLLKGKIISD